jgi:hypothetical protein
VARHRRSSQIALMYQGRGQHHRMPMQMGYFESEALEPTTRLVGLKMLLPEGIRSFSLGSGGIPVNLTV